MYLNVQLFIASKNIAVFKYSLHKFRKKHTTLIITNLLKHDVQLLYIILLKLTVNANYEHQ